MLERFGMSPPLAVDRPPPPWLIHGSYQDHPLGVLKSGKEAEVFLLERRSADGSCLLAHKRFRPRRPAKGELRELGFSKGTIYRRDGVYHEGWHLKSRDQRAVDHGTRHGHELMGALWPINEMAMLERAWAAGAAVPYPVERTSDGVVMQFIGDRERAAPRLVQAGLDAAEATEAWRQLAETLRALTRAGVVHADLSVYNVLWWQGRLVVIDFPQAVDVITNPQAPELLHRDLTNVAAWFRRRGVPVDPEAVFVELLGEMF
jgi:RIO kinase 1